MEEIIVQPIVQNSSLNNIHDDKSIEDLIDLTLLNKFEFDIAVLFHRMCKNEYKTIFTESKSDAKLTTWYILKNEKWEKEKKTKILEKIKNVLNNLYENKLDLLVIELHTITTDNISNEIIIKKINVAKKILNKLKKEYFIKNIMRESVELFYSE
jgi:ribosomal protein S25